MSANQLYTGETHIGSDVEHPWSEVGNMHFNELVESQS